MQPQPILISRISGINSRMGASVGESPIAIGVRPKEGGQKKEGLVRRRPIVATTEYCACLVMLQTCSAMAELIVARRCKDDPEVGSGGRAIGSVVRVGWSREG